MENKNIDESWKEKAEKEKTEDKTPQEQKTAEQDSYHKPDFNFFLSTMGMQAMIALGKLENPITKKQDKNLTQGRFIIDTLDMIKEKTTGNLAQEEKELLDNLLHDLKMIYAQEESTQKDGVK